MRSSGADASPARAFLACCPRMRSDAATQTRLSVVVFQLRLSFSLLGFHLSHAPATVQFGVLPLAVLSSSGANSATSFWPCRVWVLF